MGLIKTVPLDNVPVVQNWLDQRRLKGKIGENREMRMHDLDRRQTGGTGPQGMEKGCGCPLPHRATGFAVCLAELRRCVKNIADSELRARKNLQQLPSKPVRFPKAHCNFCTPVNIVHLRDPHRYTCVKYIEPWKCFQSTRILLRSIWSPS